MSVNTWAIVGKVMVALTGISVGLSLLGYALIGASRTTGMVNVPSPDLASGMGERK